MGEAREVELSSPALIVLKDLSGSEPQPADHYRPEILNELHKAGFVRDLPDGKVTITTRGLDHLMPPGRPRPYVPPAQRVSSASKPTPPVAETPAPVVTPAPAAATASASKLVGAPFVIAALKKAGGSLTREALNADGRTLRKMLSEGQIIDEGETIRLAKAVERVASAPRISVVPSLASGTKSVAASVPVEVSQTVEAHVCAEDCAICPTGRALAFLTNTSPAIKAMVERFQAHEADQQRLKTLD